MEHPEDKLKEEEKKRAWDISYECLHYGDPKARVIQVDQRQVIVLVHRLIKRIMDLEAEIESNKKL